MYYKLKEIHTVSIRKCLNETRPMSIPGESIVIGKIDVNNMVYAVAVNVICKEY